MKTIGFLISNKKYEKRRAIIPSDLKSIRNVNNLYFEKGYGKTLGYSDDDYSENGVNIVSRNDIYDQDIVCSTQPPLSTEYKYYKKGQIFFGFIDPLQQKDLSDFLIKRKMSVIAWGRMYYKNSSVFSKNNEIAGIAGLFHALTYFGKIPTECKVAIIGKGNAGNAIYKILKNIGTDVIRYGRNSIIEFKNNIGSFDIIINTVFWDILNKYRLIYKRDLKIMKKHSLIIDISCNESLEIETTQAKPIDSPIYFVDGIMHYAVDHTPTIFWKTASNSISKQIKIYLDDLIEDKFNKVLNNATIIKNGEILDDRINQYQKRLNDN